MEGMIFWLATVSDANGLYASELIWTDGDREEAWRVLGSESEVREESRRLGIPARLDGPFMIPRSEDVGEPMTDTARGIVSDLIEEATNTSAWQDALHGDDAPMMAAVSAACVLIGEDVPGATECATCAESTETRALPCDECGTIDGEA